MAELTVLEEKLAEVWGWPGGEGRHREGRGADRRAHLSKSLERMHDEADETESRRTEVAGEIDGKKTAILDKARETQGRGDRDDEDLPRRGRRRAGWLRVPDHGGGRRGRHGPALGSATNAPAATMYRSWSNGRRRSRSATSRPRSTGRSRRGQEDPDQPSRAVAMKVVVLGASGNAAYCDAAARSMPEPRVEDVVWWRAVRQASGTRRRRCGARALHIADRCARAGRCASPMPSCTSRGYPAACYLAQTRAVNVVRLAPGHGRGGARSGSRPQRLVGRG